MQIKDTKVVGVRMDEELRTWLEESAKSRRMDLSTFCRWRLLEDWSANFDERHKNW